MVIWNKETSLDFSLSSVLFWAKLLQRSQLDSFLSSWAFSPLGQSHAHFEFSWGPPSESRIRIVRPYFFIFWWTVLYLFCLYFCVFESWRAWFGNRVSPVSTTGSSLSLHFGLSPWNKPIRFTCLEYPIEEQNCRTFTWFLNPFVCICLLGHLNLKIVTCLVYLRFGEESTPFILLFVCQSCFVCILFIGFEVRSKMASEAASPPPSSSPNVVAAILDSGSIPGAIFL